MIKTTINIGKKKQKHPIASFIKEFPYSAENSNHNSISQKMVYREELLNTEELSPVRYSESNLGTLNSEKKNLKNDTDSSDETGSTVSST